jgi:membrane protein
MAGRVPRKTGMSRRRSSQRPEDRIDRKRGGTVSERLMSRIIQFLKKDIWNIRQKDLPPLKSLIFGTLKVLILSIRGVGKDRITLQASSLTFFSLLSIVPVLAMAFGIAKGFGFEKGLEKMLMNTMEGQEQVALRVMEFARGLLAGVKGGLVAGTGLLLLFFTVIKILSHIEKAVNDIWGIKKGRSIGRQITDYLSVLLIGTVLFIMSSSITVLITGGITLAMERFSFLQFLTPGVSVLLRLLPVMALWVLFSFVYVFMPNTKVSLKSGVLAGIIAGTMYYIFQWGYINLQIGIAKQNAVYGSFAALPLFFTWLQISWMIVLFGAEVSFAHQNVEMFEFEEECLGVSHSFKRLLSLRVAQLVIRRFTEGERAWDNEQISRELEIPIRLVNQILYELVTSGVLSEVMVEQDKTIAYEPARDTDTLTIKYVIDALESRGSDNIPVAQSRELESLIESLEKFGDLLDRSESNRLLKAIHSQKESLQ